MKEQKLDDLERMFRDGLQDLKAEPDAAVWLAIQDAMKKRRRFWIFWSITGMVAIGLVATVLLQNQSMDHGPWTIAQGNEETKGFEDEGTRGLGDEETRGLGDEETRGLGDEGTRGSGDEEISRQGDGEITRPGGEEMRGLGDEEISRQADGEMTRPGGEEISRPADGEMTRPGGEEMRGSGDEEISGQGDEETGRVGSTDSDGNVDDRHPEPTKGSPELAESPRRVEGQNTIASLQIPFTYPDLTSINPVFVSTYQPKGIHDPDKDIDEDTQNLSPWSLAFNPGLLLPSIQSYGKKGDVNYEKTNESKPGISMAFFLNYTFKEKWTLRTGLDWSSYTVSGSHRYFGKTDTVEWIDRKRNTGVQVIEKSRSWQFESRYQWIGIPIELGRRQTLGAGFSWDWTFGAGLNYLYSYDKLAEGNTYLEGIDEGIKRMQLSLLAGFGVNYQIFGPWSSFVNVQYRLQPNSLYTSELLREKHQILRFGIGLQYQFNRKGN